MMGVPEPSEASALRMSLACDLHQVRQAALAVRKFLSRQGCDEDTLIACELALVEGCNNAIQHAPEDAKNKPVRVEAICGEGMHIELRIADHTSGFNWPAQIELPPLGNEHGRGLFLIQSLMDGVVYLRSSGENLLILRKSTTQILPPNVRGANTDNASLTESAPFSAAARASMEEIARNGTVTLESEIAGTIRRAFLLDRLPEVPGVELAAFSRSAHQFSGDFYDVLKAANGSVLLVIADVMGKGALAALFAAILRTALRSVPEMASQPAALLARVNRLLFQELSTTGLFITAQLAYLDPAQKRMTIACAGHCPLMLKVEGSRVITKFSPDGMPLGILPDTTFLETVAELQENCRVLIYTDGVTEAINNAGERYGEERLTDWMERFASAQSTAEELKQELVSALKQFRNGTPLADDQTFLVAMAKLSSAPTQFSKFAASIGVSP